MDLDTSERVALLEEWDRRKAAWKPNDLEGSGCLMMIAGVVLLIATPKLIGALKLSLPKGAGTALLAFYVVLIVGGFIVKQVRILKEAPADIAERAVAALTTSGVDDETRRRETVALLFHASDQRGMRIDRVYDPAVCAQRLGPALDYVLAAEAVLAAEKRSGRVFAA